jgi:hypothetical protein
MEQSTRMISNRSNRREEVANFRGHSPIGNLPMNGFITRCNPAICRFLEKPRKRLFPPFIGTVPPRLGARCLLTSVATRRAAVETFW